jgi:hypothetical protein
MIQELQCCRVQGAQRGSLRWRLGIAPWLWPTDDDQRRITWATGIVGGARTELEPGRTLAVSINDSGGTLWVLADDGDLKARVAPPSWGRKATRAWKYAVLAVSRILPVVGVGLKELVLDIPHAHYLDSAPKSHGSCRVEHSLDGSSYGLAFALYLVSHLTNLPLPDDVAALASVDADGDVGPVGALREKVEAIRRLAPGVRRVVISDQQEAVSEIDSESGLQLIQVSSVSAAVARLFDGNLTERLVASAVGAEQRRALVQAFFKTVVTGHASLVHWLPVHRAAGVALTSWSDLDPNDGYRLEFVRAVAGRHEHGENTLTLPPAGWIDAHPMPLRAGIVASLLQHSADTGTPAPDEVETVAHAYSANAEEAYIPQLAVQYGIARLFAVTGRSEQALALQSGIARAFLAVFDDDGAQPALAEWFRLAGVCHHARAFAEAESCWGGVKARGGSGADGWPVVELSRCRAGLELGHLRPDIVVRTLGAIHQDETLPAHVRWSALRWRVRAAAAGAAAADHECGAALSILDSEIARCLGEGGPLAAIQPQVFGGLIRLDQCVASGEHHDAQRALEELLRLRGGPVRHLIRACPSGESVPAYVARFYPY